jgi:hypothetical protein
MLRAQVISADSNCGTSASATACASKEGATRRFFFSRRSHLGFLCRAAVGWALGKWWCARQAWHTLGKQCKYIR